MVVAIYYRSLYSLGKECEVRSKLLGLFVGLVNGCLLNFQRKLLINFDNPMYHSDSITAVIPPKAGVEEVEV